MAPGPDELPRIAGLQETYTLVRRLGGGGMGSVFLVQHRQSGELRVVKVMRPEIADDPTLRQRFEREARMAEQLHHPNLAQVFADALSVEHRQAFLVLEYIDGITFEKVIQARPPLPLRLAVELARQAAEAVAFLHSRSLVHRDITPDNLMLRRERDGQPLVKLIDLGIAKPLTGSSLTSVGSFLGKLWYASPEQLEGGIGDHGAVGPPSDVYSLGMVIYELVTGAFPFAGSTHADAVQAHLFAAPQPFSTTDPGGRLPASLRQLVLHCLEKQPGRRPASARDVAARLRAAMDELRPEAESVPSALTRLLGPPPAPPRRVTQPWAPGQAAAIAAAAAPRPAPAAPPPPAARTTAPARPATATAKVAPRVASVRNPRDSTTPFFVAGLLVLLALAGAGVWWMLRREPGPPATDAAAGSSAAPTASAPSAAQTIAAAPVVVASMTEVTIAAPTAALTAEPTAAPTPSPAPTPTLAPVGGELALAAATPSISGLELAPRATAAPRPAPSPRATPRATASPRATPTSAGLSGYGSRGGDIRIEIPFDGPAAEATTAPAKSAHLFGTLRSIDGSPISGATVRLLPDAGGPPAVTVTGDDGRYDFAALEPGRYLAEVERTGFVTARSRFTLVSGKQQFNLGLQPQP